MLGTAARRGLALGPLRAPRSRRRRGKPRAPSRGCEVALVKPCRRPVFAAAAAGLTEQTPGSPALGVLSSPGPLLGFPWPVHRSFRGTARHPPTPPSASVSFRPSPGPRSPGDGGGYSFRCPPAHPTPPVPPLSAPRCRRCQGRSPRSAPARRSPALRGGGPAGPAAPAGLRAGGGKPLASPGSAAVPRGPLPRHPRGAGGGVPPPPGSARSPAPNRLPAAGGPGGAGLPRCPSRAAGEERGGFGSALIYLPAGAWCSSFCGNSGFARAARWSSSSPHALGVCVFRSGRERLSFEGKKHQGLPPPLQGLLLGMSVFLNFALT